MIGPLLLLAASVSPLPPTQVDARSAFRPVSRVTARATATIRIISGVSFGADRAADIAGAIRRKGQLADGDGTLRHAELLEFQ